MYLVSPLSFVYGCRLFGRVKSIRQIINALTSSLIPIMNAFGILLICMALFAIVGVFVFAEDAPDDFGNLTHALVTMFLAGGGEWIDGLTTFDESGNIIWGPTLFIVMYVIIVNWTVLQVSMAVLLDNFSQEV